MVDIVFLTSLSCRFLVTLGRSELPAVSTTVTTNRESLQLWSHAQSDSTLSKLRTPSSNALLRLRVGAEGSALAQFERETFPELFRLATDVLDAGVHFQGLLRIHRSVIRGWG